MVRNRGRWATVAGGPIRGVGSVVRKDVEAAECQGETGGGRLLACGPPGQSSGLSRRTPRVG
eukprot:7214212-Alexandrium_andersonii.AAC.1